MIDWANVAANALWIFACSLALATLSYAYWLAGEEGVRFRAVLARPGIQASLNVAGLIFSLGLAFTADSVLQTAIWLVLAVLFAFQVVSGRLAQRRK